MIIIMITTFIVILIIMTVIIVFTTVMCYRNHRPCLGPLYSALHVYVGTQRGTIILTKLSCRGYKATWRILTAQRLFEEFLIYNPLRSRSVMSLNHVPKTSSEIARSKVTTTLRCSFFRLTSRCTYIRLI